jgi:hypothetical protein
VRVNDDPPRFEDALWTQLSAVRDTAEYADIWASTIMDLPTATLVERFDAEVVGKAVRLTWAVAAAPDIEDGSTT